MNGEQLRGNVRALKGGFQQFWGRLTNDPWMRIAGRREQLLGRLQASLAHSRQIAAATFPTLPRPASPGGRHGPNRG